MDLKYMGLNFRRNYPCKGGNNYNKYSSNNICYIDCRQVHAIELS